MSRALALVLALGFLEAVPERPLAFPRDHAAHPDYKTEWWYYTGHLDAADGRTFGYELTFFRLATPPRAPLGPRRSKWEGAQALVAHFAVTDEAAGRFQFFDRRFRGGTGQADASTDRLDVYTGAWQAKAEGGAHHLVARQAAAGLAIDLLARPQTPPVPHGKDGYSQKADCAGCASHYYSFPRMATSGTVAIGGQRIPVQGSTWMDHEFGGGRLAPGMTGWDWCGVTFEDGTALMLYGLRDAKGERMPQASGTWIDAKGHGRHLTIQDFTFSPTGTWKSPRNGATYPSGWRMAVPSAGLEVTATPVLKDQELDTAASTGETYWEGLVRLAGTRLGKPTRGRGYVELTGYARPYTSR